MAARFAAKFDGFCHECNKPYRKGQIVYGEKRHVWTIWCESCDQVKWQKTTDDASQRVKEEKAKQKKYADDQWNNFWDEFKKHANQQQPPRMRADQHLKDQATLFFGSCRTLDELKKKHKELARKYHPDMGGDPEMMKAVNAAFDYMRVSF